MEDWEKNSLPSLAAFPQEVTFRYRYLYFRIFIVRRRVRGAKGEATMKTQEPQRGTTRRQLKRLTLEQIKPVEEALAPTKPKPMSGFGWGQCTNSTDEILLVYGPHTPGSRYDNTLFCLPPGWTTPDNWDCDGFFVPNDRIANQAFSKLAGPLAIKYYDTRNFEVIKSAPNEYECYFNNGAYSPGTINWQIPDIDYSVVAAVCLS